MQQDSDFFLRCDIMNIINELNFADLLISKDSYNFRFLEGQPYPICNV
ncbi:type II/IV secretion system family protein, partial [Escherichia coli]|nr:type II/IV secretion system family protein [Escherichia coli]